MTERPIEQYVHLLDVRKRQAKVGSIALGGVLGVSLIAAFGWLWMTRFRPITGSNALIVVVLCVYPVFGLVNQLLAYRRMDEMLELLDVLKREYGARPAPITAQNAAQISMCARLPRPASFWRAWMGRYRG